MGRSKYSQGEIETITRLLKKKNAGNRAQQKEIRHKLRTEFEFNISDFNEPGKAFGAEELMAAIERGAISILDDATIADMKAKRARDKTRDEVAKLVADNSLNTTSWQDALKEWKEWESQSGNK